jgi:hypothetical protein
MEDPVNRLGRLLSNQPPVKSAFLCTTDWKMHSCFLLKDHKGTHLCVCGERMAR